MLSYEESGSGLIVPVRLIDGPPSMTGGPDLISGVLMSVLQAYLDLTPAEYTDAFGGLEKITVRQLARVANPGERERGLSFEYAIHHAIRSGQPIVCQRLAEGMRALGIDCEHPRSILFGGEKAKRLSYTLESTIDELPHQAVIATGATGRRPHIRTYLSDLIEAFHNPKVHDSLPKTLRGIVRADLFLGSDDGLVWVAASLKSGLRTDTTAPPAGIRMRVAFKSLGSRADRASGFEEVNLYQYGAFYDAWNSSVRIVTHVLSQRGTQPRPQDLSGHELAIAKWLYKYADRPVAEAVANVAEASNVSSNWLMRMLNFDRSQLLVEPTGDRSVLPTGGSGLVLPALVAA